MTGTTVVYGCQSVHRLRSFSLLLRESETVDTPQIATLGAIEEDWRSPAERAEKMNEMAVEGRKKNITKYAKIKTFNYIHEEEVVYH